MRRSDLGALGERENEFSSIHGGFLLVGDTPAWHVETPKSVHSAGFFTRRPGSGAIAQSTVLPYISPSGSLISSMRAPSGSRKYSDESMFRTLHALGLELGAEVLPPVRGDGDREVVEPTEDLGVVAEAEVGEVEEGDRVAVAEVEEEVGGALVVAVLEEIRERELEHVLVEVDRPLDVG